MGIPWSSQACLSNVDLQAENLGTHKGKQGANEGQPAAIAQDETQLCTTLASRQEAQERATMQEQLQLQLKEVQAIANTLQASVLTLSTLPPKPSPQQSDLPEQQTDLPGCLPDLPGSLSPLHMEANSRNREQHALSAQSNNSCQDKEALQAEVEQLAARVKALESQLAEMHHMREDWEAHRAAQEFSKQIRKLEEVGIPMHLGAAGAGGGFSNLARMSGTNSRASSRTMSIAEELPSLEGLPHGRYPKPQAHPLHGPLGGGHYTKPSRRTTRTSSTSNKGSTQAWGPAEHSASHGGIDHGTGGTVQGPALCAPGAPQGALKTPGKHKRHNSRGGALGKRVQPHVQLVDLQGPSAPGQQPLPAPVQQQEQPPPTRRRQQQHQQYAQHSQCQHRQQQHQQQQQQQHAANVGEGAPVPALMPAAPLPLPSRVRSLQTASDGSDGTGMGSLLVYQDDAASSGEQGAGSMIVEREDEGSGGEQGAGSVIVARDEEGGSEQGQGSTSMLVQPPDPPLQPRNSTGCEGVGVVEEEEEEEEFQGSVVEAGANSHGGSFVGSLWRQAVPWASRAACKAGQGAGLGAPGRDGEPMPLV